VDGLGPRLLLLSAAPKVASLSLVGGGRPVFLETPLVLRV